MKLDQLARAKQYDAHRIKYLPRQLEETRHKLAALEAEARRRGLTELLKG